MEHKIFVVDVETGGLLPKENGICSVCIKEYGTNRILDIFIKPNKDLVYEDKAFEVNGLSLEFLEKEGIPEDEAVMMIKEFVGEYSYMLGQHTKFDFEFLMWMFKRNDECLADIFSYKLLDTSTIAMFLDDCGLTKFPSHSLGNMYEEVFGESIIDAHTSKGDVLATERLYDYFKSRVEGKE